MIDLFYTKVTFIILILKRENVNVKIESIIKMFFLDNDNNMVKSRVKRELDLHIRLTLENVGDLDFSNLIK